MFTAVRRVVCQGRRDQGVARASSRAAQTLVVLFMTSALIAVALVTPQSSTAAGVELVMSAVLCGAALLTLDRRALDATEPGVARTIERFSLNDHRAVGRVPSLWQRVSRRLTMPRTVCRNPSHSAGLAGKGLHADIHQPSLSCLRASATPHDQPARVTGSAARSWCWWTGQPGGHKILTRSRGTPDRRDRKHGRTGRRPWEGQRVPDRCRLSLDTQVTGIAGTLSRRSS